MSAPGRSAPHPRPRPRGWRHGSPGGREGRALPTRTVATPVGALTVEVAGGAVTALHWHHADRADADPLLDRAARQLTEYFAGGRTAFDLPLAPQGSPHDRAVWRAMTEIPYGATESYGALARRVGTGARSVGGACARNPIPVIVPCHRVVGVGGALGGYSGQGGTETKRRLLDHETVGGVTRGPI